MNMYEYSRIFNLHVIRTSPVSLGTSERRHILPIKQTAFNRHTQGWGLTCEGPWPLLSTFLSYWEALMGTIKYIIPYNDDQSPQQLTWFSFQRRSRFFNETPSFLKFSAVETQNFGNLWTTNIFCSPSFWKPIAFLGAQDARGPLLSGSLAPSGQSLHHLWAHLIH